MWHISTSWTDSCDKYQRTLICTSRTHSYASRTHSCVTNNMKGVLYVHNKLVYAASQTHSYASRTHSYVQIWKKSYMYITNAFLCITNSYICDKYERSPMYGFFSKKILASFWREKKYGSLSMCLASKRDPKGKSPFGSLLQHLGLFCNIWDSFTTFGSLWHISGLFDNIWVSFATFGSLLQYVFHFRCVLQKRSQS